MPAFNAENGMPYWLDLVTSDSKAATEFYARVVGWDFTDQGQWSMARIQGLPVAGVHPSPDTAMDDMWVSYFLTDDIAADVARAVELGATVAAPPTSVTLGSMAVLSDPTGGFFGLLQPDESERFVAAGEPGTMVWTELTCPRDFDKAVSFYGELFDWNIDRHADAEGGDYAIALHDGAPFVGIWDAHNQFEGDSPSFWQSYLGVRDLAEVAETVTEAGGQLVTEPFDSPFGPLLVIKDPTGAVVTVCEVDEPVFEGHEGDELAGLDLSQFQ